MRLDNLEFEDFNTDSVKEPIVVIELSFDDANTDIHYLTSKPVTGLTGNIINDTLKIVSSTSQKLNPEKARSTIGNIKFECLDVGLTALQKSKLDEGKGLNGKRVRVHFGYVGLNWDRFVTVQTQIISGSISYNKGVYQFSCADVQRLARKKLFVLKETTATASAGPDDTTLTVTNTTGFETVFQPPLSGSVAPGQTVGFLKIEHNDTFSIVSYTGKTPTTFTGVTQGLLGTPKLDFSVEVGQRGPKVEEFVYMAAPAIMIAYALYTGSWYGYPGEFLPDHWHLGVSTDYIKTSDFVNHVDLWDTSDIDKGVPATVQGVSDEDGKRFIEEQLYFMLGLYSPINTDGELGLKRLFPIVGNGATVRTLDETNVVSHGELMYDLKAIVNRYVLKWNYSISDDRYTRASVMLDEDSINKHGKSDVKVIELRNLYGSDDSARIIFENFENLRTRTASPPYRLRVELTPDQNDLEVGDIVTVNLKSLKDVNNADEYLHRNFEVQSVRIDWSNGRVHAELFGSSELPGSLTPDERETLDTSFLSVDVPTGNHINATNFPGAVTSSGGLTRITSDISLTGHANLNNSACHYYCAEDLQIDVGVTVTIDSNVQIRVDGYMTNNGTIDGKGNGHAGIIDNRTLGIAYDFDFTKSGGAGLGTVGGVGLTKGQGGLEFYERIKAFGSNYKAVKSYFNHASTTTEFAWRYSIPALALRLNGSNIEGLPSSLMGTSGGCGGSVNDTYEQLDTMVARGGPGGASGAGLVIIASGFDMGDNAKVDLSGLDGGLGESAVSSSRTLIAGSGAGGHPGGLLILATDSTQFTEQPTEGKFIFNVGISPESGGIGATGQKAKSGQSYSSRRKGELAENSAFDASGNPTNPNQNVFESFTKIVYLDALASFDADEESYVQTDPTFTLSEQTNTPVTPEGDRSTIEVSVTPPADNNYSYSVVEYRETGSDVWIAADPASNESLIEVASNGATYEIRIKAVSKSGVVNPTGPTNTITVLDRNGRTDAELAVVYPFAPITNLGLDISGDAFEGIDVVFEWDHDNGEKAYFNYYQIEIHNDTQLLRTEKSVNPFYTYSYAKNLKDYRALNGGVTGVNLNLNIRVKPVSKYYNNLSSLYAGDQVTFYTYATFTVNESNLRYFKHREQLESDINDAGQTADWDGVSNRPDSRIFNNLVDMSEWTASTNPSLTGWSKVGDSDENEIILADGPFNDELIWRCTSNNTTVNDPDGGLLTNYAPVDTNKAYRFSIWMRRVDSETTGVNYLGLYTLGGAIQRLDGGNDGNPYFWWGDLPEANKWYLVLAYVWPHDTTRTNRSDLSGVYDPETGQRVDVAQYDFKFQNLASMQVRARAYYYSGDIGERNDFARPRIDEVNGDEPTVQELLLGGDPTGLLNTNQQWSDLNNRPSDVELLNYVDDATGIFIKQPNGARKYFSSATGALKIVLPQRRSSTFMSFTVDIYNYQTGGSCTVVVGGYNFNDGLWRRGFARIIGNPESEYTVRFGEDASNSLIYIGDTDTVWTYTTVTVKDFQGSHLLSDYASWGSGWDITSTTTFENVSITKTDTLVHASDVNHVGGVPVATVLDDISNAQSTADGKISSTFSATAPSSPDTDDIWIDTGDDNKIKVWNGSSWVEASDNRIAATVIAAQTAQSTADSKAEVFFSESTPTAETGDLWYKPSTKEVKRFNGVAWEDFATWGAKWGVDIDDVPGNLAALTGTEQIQNQEVYDALLGQGASLIPDFNTQNHDFWYSHYAYDLSSKFISVSDGKVSQYAYRHTTGYDWNYTKTNVPLIAGKKLLHTAWVRKSADADGTFHLPYRRRYPDNADNGYGHTAINQATIGTDWTLVSAVIDCDTEIAAGNAFVRPGFAANHNGTTGWIEVQGVRCSYQVAGDDVADELINGNISINSNGQLVGAGGGQVTIGGLGYVGDLDANRVNNTSQLTDDAGLGQTADWDQVTGANKPADNADVTDYTDYRVSNSEHSGSMLTISQPSGARFSSPSSTATGAIVVHLPQGWTNTMVKFMLDVYLYEGTGLSFSLAVGGYTYSSESRWYNSFAQLYGSKNVDNRVRFGEDPSGKCCVIIGEESSVWPHIKASVKNFQAGYANFSVAQWDTGWSITLENDLTGAGYILSPGADISDSLIDAASIIGQGALATENAVDWNTHITGKPNDSDILNSNVTLATLGYTGDLDADKTNYSDPNIANTQISILADGTLVGAGGGSVSLTGLGFAWDDVRIANNTTADSVTKIPSPIGATYSNSTTTGMIVIHLPQGWSNTMMKFVIDVYVYEQDKSFSVAVGGYNYTAQSKWLNTFAQLSGYTGANNRVRFGISPAGKCCVVIGSTTDSWSIPKISVRDFQAGYSNHTIDQWKDGWDITIESSETGYTFTPESEISDARLDLAAVKGTGVLAAADSIAWGSSELTGIPQRFTDSATTGINVTNEYLGYYDGSTWKAYIDDNGYFKFTKDANNYIEYTGGTLQVRGDVEATSIAASTSISAPTITGGSISGANITGTTINGATITGGTVQTSSDTNTERLVLDSTGVSLSGYWEVNTEGMTKYLHIGKHDYSGTQWAVRLGLIGGELPGGMVVYAEDHGVRATVSNFNALYGYSSGTNGVHGEISGTAGGYAFSANSSRAFGIMDSEGAYLDFRGGVAALYLKTDDPLTKGNAVRVTQVLKVTDQLQNCLMEVEPATVDAAIDVLGIVIDATPIYDGMINNMGCFSGVLSGTFAGYQSTHYMAIVATDGVVVAHVNGLHGAVDPGDILCVDGGTDGTLRLYGSPTHGRKVAKALGSVANGSNGDYIPVRML